MSKPISRTVWILAIVSLFTDMASEMLYPVMPMFLKSIGFSVLGIGVLEGIAQATAGLSKGFFGNWSDQAHKRVPFVQWGYFLSAVSKPLMAIWTNAWWVLFARTTDRLGKGIRTGARDALLSAEATSATKGRIFGFHRSMDTLGAAIGPALALLFLWYFPGSYQTLFFLAFAPGILAIGATFLLKETAREISPGMRKRPGFFEFLNYLPISPGSYQKLIAGLLVFALFNSSDLFLLLVLKERGMDDSVLISLYIYYNLVYALAAYPAGMLSDRVGKKRVFVVGVLLFAMVYGGMTIANNWLVVGALFFLYGLYAAFTEGVAKAWISNLCGPSEVATAIGTYDGLSSLVSLVASSLAGFIWYQWGAGVMFGTTALAAFGLVFYFGLFSVVDEGKMVD